MAALMLAEGSTWAQDHVRRNANGTVTVTMYDDDGNPHDVVVTSRIPLDSSGNPAFSGNSGVDSAWSIYYEKAFAIASEHGSDGESGYGGTEGGSATDDAQLMTGSDADGIDPDYDDVREAFENGQPVIAGTVGDDDDVPEDMKNAFAKNHMFYVQGFDVDGNILLGNPWGPDEEVLVLTPDEFEDNFDNAAALNP